MQPVRPAAGRRKNRRLRNLFAIHVTVCDESSVTGPRSSLTRPLLAVNNARTAKLAGLPAVSSQSDNFATAALVPNFLQEPESYEEPMVDWPWFDVACRLLHR